MIRFPCHIMNLGTWYVHEIIWNPWHYFNFNICLLCQSERFQLLHCSIHAEPLYALILSFFGSWLRVCSHVPFDRATTQGKGNGMKEEWIAYVLKQTLQGLKYFHDQGQVWANAMLLVYGLLLIRVGVYFLHIWRDVLQYVANAFRAFVLHETWTIMGPIYSAK